MPLVFAESEVTGSGIRYDDRTGIAYQFPRRYRRMIREGEVFVYYRGRRMRGGASSPQVYFGAGVVGQVAPDPTASDRLVCEILAYRPFDEPVYFKDDRGQYLETGAERRGYFQPGVRRISNEDFGRILERATSDTETMPESEAGDMAQRAKGGRRGSGHASSETARAVDDFALRVACEELRRRFAGACVARQPRNNPGFDLLLHQEGGEVIYVEVKGSQGSSPRFFLTEGERRFSTRHADRYLLLVVHHIRLEEGTYTLTWHQGAISAEEGCRMEPTQWACELGRW